MLSIEAPCCHMLQGVERCIRISENVYYQSLDGWATMTMGMIEAGGRGTVAVREVAGAWLAAGSKAEGTRRAYARAVGEALEAMGATTMGEVTPARVAAWAETVRASTAAANTKAQRIAAVRSWLRFADEVEALPEGWNVERVLRHYLKAPKPQARVRDVLRDAEAAAMLERASGARDQAILGLLMGAGLRRAEVAGLNVGDLHDGDAGAMLTVRGKGDKLREVPLAGDVEALLTRYLVETGRTLADSGPMFLAGPTGRYKAADNRIGASTVHALVCRYAGEGVKRITPHGLRATFALRALRAGGNVEAVRQLLGHSSIQTTQIYLRRLDTEALRAAVPALPTVTGGSAQPEGGL